MHIHKRGHFSEINQVGIVGFFTTFALAAITTIWAVYLDSYIHNASYVGFLTAIWAIIGTITFIYGVPLIERQNKVKTYTSILGLLILSYLAFYFFPHLYVIIGLGILVTILGSLRISLYGIIVRGKSKDKSVSKNEGYIYALLNVAFILAPLVAGYLAAQLGFRSVFLFGAALIFLSIISLRCFHVKEIKTKNPIDKKPLKLFFTFFKDKNKRLAYILGGGIDFWWVLIYVFIPIFMYEHGLGDKILGYFLAAIGVPLVLSEYATGKIANKKGFKTLFMSGYTILGLAALTCFFIPNIYLILLILVLASFGAAMTEPTTEAYFFDIVKKTDRERFYPSYNTAINVSSFFARALSALVLLILPFKFVFILYAAVMFAVALLSSRVKPIVEAK